MANPTTPGTEAKSGPSLPLLSGGTVLQDRYRIMHELGSGGMGAVYEAVDQRLDVTVAIKQTFSIDEKLRRQFEQEARLLAQLHHSSLPRVSDYFTEDGRAFLVMQFIAGEDLAQVIARQASPFAFHQVIAWADQLLDALVYLHTRDRRIIHRDIKPHNLKLTESGQIALLDFGLAKAHGGDHSTTQSSNSIFGYTRRYSPLEQIQDLGTSPQSDLYALGATLYHLLTGAKPPDALVRAAALANGKADPLQLADQINPAVGHAVAEILRKAMALHAADRFESAAEFRGVLRQLGRRIEEGSETPGKLPGSRHATEQKTPRKTDPFDSYSILKPEAEVFRLAKPNRHPALIAVAAAIVLISLVGSYPSGFVSSLVHLLESPRVNPTTKDATTALRQTRAESIEFKSAAKPNATGNAPEGSHQKDLEKKRSRRNLAKVNGVKPPAFSITP
jgi:serine/threonine protein kinase